MSSPRAMGRHRGGPGPAGPCVFPCLLLLSAALLLAGTGEEARAGAARVLGIRHSSNEGNTRIVIDLSQPARFEHMKLDDPPRVAIDIEADLAPELQPLAVNDGRVQRIRLGRPDDAHSRLVVDLDRILDYRGFEVAAGGERGPRLVFDFFGQPAAVSAGKEPPAPAAPAPAVIEPPARRGPVIVVLDAGHGGQDPGAQAHDSREKEICLEIARRVAADLNRREGYRARLTRDDDRFIPLRQRIALAEKAGADVFVSIHCNASKDAAAHGTEVYYLSLSGATDEASRELARLENAADLMGGVAPEADDDLTSILFDMQQTEILQRGARLADEVVEELRRHPDLTTRGVKQAGFVVLKSPKIPSILVEAAFITNRRENKLLRSGSFQQSFARRLADGIDRFFQSTLLVGQR